MTRFRSKVFHGTVTEIGDNAIVRSTGVSTSQATSTSEEAKDFKVVVTLTDPPGSAAGAFNNREDYDRDAERCGQHSDPGVDGAQSGDLAPKDGKGSGAGLRGPVDTAKQKEEIQGVFVIRNKKAEFVPVETGISGTTDIEVTKGVKEGDEIITGSYKVLRTLKPGTSVKIDNSAPEKEEESS